MNQVQQGEDFASFCRNEQKKAAVERMLQEHRALQQINQRFISAKDEIIEATPVK